MGRKVSTVPHPSQESGINLVLLAMAADIPHERSSAELMAEYAEELAGNGEKAEALDWFARILEGGEPELAPHAALRMGQVMIDDDLTATLAALRYAADHGGTQVAACARQNLEAIERHGAGARPERAPVQEVLGRGALARGLLWYQAGKAPAAVDSFQDATGCGIPLIEAHALFELAVILEDNGDVPGAQEAYQRAIGLHQPQYSGKAAVNLGILLSRQLDLKGAQAAWQAAAGAGDPGQAAKARSMLTELAQLGDLDQAQEAAQGIDMNDPAVIGAGALAAGQRFLERGDLESAIHAFEKAMDTGHPLHAPKGAARVALAFSLIQGEITGSGRRGVGRRKRGRGTGAQTAINRLTEVGHGHLVPRAWFCFGALMLRGGKLADADAAFRRVPDSASDAHAAALCVLWIMRGDAARSEPQFRHILSTAPDLVSEVIDLALDLGDYQARTGDHGTARGTFSLGCHLAELSGQPDLIAQARQARDG